MTPEELQEVVAAVIAALKTNGKTIDQLTAVTSLADTDNLEISNGKKVSFGKLKELVAAAVTVSAEEIKGWEMIESTDDLPEDPTQAQQEKAYVIADTSTMYVYVGYGGDTLDGLYQSLNMKGEDGAPGPPGADGHDGVDLGEVALVNNLTEGGEGSALSAEQGVVLKGMVDEFDNAAVKASFVGSKLVLQAIDTQSAEIVVSGLTKQNVAASVGNTDTTSFTISGTKITQSITISLSDTTNFSVSPSSISAPQGGTLAETEIVVTYSPASGQSGDTHSCTITVTYNGAAVSTLNLTGIIAQRKAAGSTFTVADLIYTVLENTSNVSVQMTSTSLPAGAVVIPATVNDENGVSYNVTEIPADGFKKNTKITSLTLPEGLTTIGADAIRENSLLETLNIPNSVTSLGNNNTYKCEKLASLTIGTGITALPEYFYGLCGNDKSLIIPDNIVSVNNYAFTSTGFTSLTFGSNFASFAGNIKCKMQSGSSVTIKATTPPTISSGYPFGFDASGQYVAPYKSQATLYVPSSAVSTYQSAKPWGTADNSGNGMFTDTNQIQAITE